MDGLRFVQTQMTAFNADMREIWRSGRPDEVQGHSELKRTRPLRGWIRVRCEHAGEFSRAVSRRNTSPNAVSVAVHTRIQEGHKPRS